MSRDLTLKQETIEEVNELLDSISPKAARQILSKLTCRDILTLKWAIEEKIRLVGVIAKEDLE